MATLIQSIASTGGFLENAEIELGPHLNCIIGSRGTCKSTIVESIRFAFNADPARIKVLEGLGKPDKSDDTSLAGFYNMIGATLGSGSIRCKVVETTGGESASYSIERDLNAASRIYKDGVKDHTDTTLIEQIEIYSQGDLQRIASNQKLRLELIDRPNATKIKRLRLAQAEAATALRKSSRQIYELRATIIRLKSMVEDLPQLKSLLSEARSSRPELSNELDKQHDLYIRRTSALRAARVAIGTQSSAIELIRQLEENRAQVLGQVQEIEVQRLDETASVIGTLLDLANGLKKVIDYSSKLEAMPLNGGIEDMSSLFDRQNELYFELRALNQEANEAIKRESELQKQVDHLSTYVREMLEVESRLNDQILSRKTLRESFKRMGDEITQFRLAEIERINTRHAEMIILELEEGAQSAEYVERINHLFEGSRLRNRDEVSQALASAVTPSELVDIVEAEDVVTLASALNRDVTYADRILSFLAENAGVFDLEGLIFDDSLNIVMYDDGEPKPVESLSKGQKATALLPLILRPADYPLIFDQPEDDLDNRFIVNYLVKTIRELKGQRQIIFVTHNANIPVIGEAEDVIVMRMESPERAANPTRGTVDECKMQIVDLLEGGAIAFIERHRRYEGLV